MKRKIFPFEISLGLLKLCGCHVTLPLSTLYPSPWGQLTPCGGHVAPLVVHIVSVQFLIRLLMYTLSVFFHYLEHKLKVPSLVTDLVEWDSLRLFLPLHKELKCKKLFLYKIFYWNKRNVKRTSHSLAINATIGVLLTLLVCCTCFLFFIFLGREKSRKEYYRIRMVNQTCSFSFSFLLFSI